MMKPDLTEARNYILSLSFDNIINKFVYVHKWRRIDAIKLAETYKNYLYLKRKYYGKYELPPSEEIDLFWHYHILDTERYTRDCEQIFGQLLHHGPLYPNESGEIDSSEYDVLFDNTLRLYENEFGVKLRQIRGITGVLSSFLRSGFVISSVKFAQYLFGAIIIAYLGFAFNEYQDLNSQLDNLIQTNVSLRIEGSETYFLCQQIANQKSGTADYENNLSMLAKNNNNRNNLLTTMVDKTELLYEKNMINLNQYNEIAKITRWYNTLMKAESDSAVCQYSVKSPDQLSSWSNSLNSLNSILSERKNFFKWLFTTNPTMINQTPSAK